MKILRLMFLIFTLISMNIICLTITTFRSGPANLLNLREPYVRLSRTFLKRKFVLVTQRCLMINAVLPSRDCNTIILFTGGVSVPASYETPSSSTTIGVYETTTPGADQ